MILAGDIGGTKTLIGLFDFDARARFLARQRQVPELFTTEPADGSWKHQRPAPPQAYHAVSRGLYSSELGASRRSETTPAR